MPEITSIVSTVGACVGGLASIVLGYVFGRAIKWIVVKYTPPSPQANETPPLSAIEIKLTELTREVIGIKQTVEKGHKDAAAQSAAVLLTAVERIANHLEGDSSYELSIPTVLIRRRMG